MGRPLSRYHVCVDLPKRTGGTIEREREKERERERDLAARVGRRDTHPIKATGKGSDQPRRRSIYRLGVPRGSNFPVVPVAATDRVTGRTGVEREVACLWLGKK